MSTTAVGPWRLIDDSELATTPEDTRGLVETKVGPTGKKTIGANVAAIGESPVEVIAGSRIPVLTEAAVLTPPRGDDNNGAVEGALRTARVEERLKPEVNGRPKPEVDRGPKTGVLLAGGKDVTAVKGEHENTTWEWEQERGALPTVLVSAVVAEAPVRVPCVVPVQGVGRALVTPETVTGEKVTELVEVVITVEVGIVFEVVTLPAEEKGIGEV